MARFSFRSALAALALGVAVLGSATLASSDASAKGMGGGHGGGHSGMHGGGKFHVGGFHGGGFGGRFHGGIRVGFYGPAYVGAPYEVGGCFVKRVIDEDGDILLRKVCY